MFTVEVRSKVFGRLQESPELVPVFLNLLKEHLTVAELIQRSVEEQIRELVVKRRSDAQQACWTLERHSLIASEIAAQVQCGAVLMPQLVPPK
jgi:hypothetical protein